MNYSAWTPMTDTQEIRRELRAPIADWTTEEIRFPWFLPSTPTRVTRRSRWARIKASPAAAHLKASAWATVLPAVFCVCFLISVLIQLQALTPVSAIR